MRTCRQSHKRALYETTINNCGAQAQYCRGGRNNYRDATRGRRLSKNQTA